MKLGEFFVELGVHGAQGALSSVKNLVKAFGDLPVEAAGALLAVAGFEYGLARLTNRAIETAIGLKAFTSQTGLSGQELQRWQGVAEQANVSAEAVASSVSALEKNMAAIRLGQGNIAPFQMFGIGVNQNAFGVLNQLRGKIHGMPSAMATNMISQMGLDPNMVQVLKLSNKEFERMAKNYHGLSLEQETTFLKAKQSLVEFNLKIRQTAFDHIEVFIRALEKLWGLMGKFQTELPVILGALGLIAAAFAPWTAAIVGLLIVLDDLAEFFTGGDSVTGRAVDGMKKLAQQMKEIFNFIPEAATKGTQAAWQKTLQGMIMAPLAPFAAVAGPAALGAGAAGKGGNVFNIVVNATAKADEVAAHVMQEIKKTFGHAEMQTNNQGH
jgi:hypothetical protein